jgi:tetratricopeptide (TPR) repeat protein
MNRKTTISYLLLVMILSGCSWFQAKDLTRVNPDVLNPEKERWQKEIDRKFDNAEAHYQLGKIYQGEGLLERADWEFTLALQFDPVMYKAQAAKVRVYQDMRRFDKSKLAAELYISQVAASAESSAMLGRGFQQEGLDDYALTCYQQALARAPNSAALHKQIGFYYLGKNDLVRAEEYLRRSVQIDPYQPEVAEQLGRMGVVIQVPQGQNSGAATGGATNQP